MPTKVYLSGSRVIIEKAGSTTLSIPQYRAKFQFFGVEPIDNLDGYTNVKFTDTITLSNVEDKIDKIQDSTGAFIGTNKQVQDYLQGFISLSDSYITKIEPCTAANQEIMITQNEKLQDLIINDSITQKESLEKILIQTKKTNLYHRVITGDHIKNDEVENENS